jgi:hypothetical protein
MNTADQSPCRSTFADAKADAGGGFAETGLQARLMAQRRGPVRGIAEMRVFVAVAALLALTALPAQAQGRRPTDGPPKSEPKKPVVDEKAYKAALERIPEPRDKYDPWSGARPAETSKKPK